MRTWLRARLATWMLQRVWSLLDVEPKDHLDFDTCTFCGAEVGMEGDGPEEHQPGCEMLTGLHTVTLRDLWPGGPSCCDGCGTTLWPGETEAHIPIGDAEGIPILEVACVGCAAHAAVKP